MPAKKKKSGNALMPEPAGVWAGVDKSYRAEEDHRTLTRAGEIKADKDRMKAVKDHHNSMNKNMEKVCK